MGIGRGEQIDTLSGNLNFSTQLFKALGRGGSGVGITFSYNSQGRACPFRLLTFDDPQGFSGEVSCCAAVIREGRPRGSCVRVSLLAGRRKDGSAPRLHGFLVGIAAAAPSMTRERRAVRAACGIRHGIMPLRSGILLEQSGGSGHSRLLRSRS